MPSILGANSVSDSYEITNSLRFARGDSQVLERTFSGSPTSTKICTISFWTKLADPSNTDAKAIFSAIKSGSNEDVIKFMGVNNGILNSLEINFNNTNAGTMMVSSGNDTLIKFRDPSAWYHFVIAIDSSQGTASNRVKVYVNGTQFDVEARVEGGSITDDVVLTQDYALAFLTASKHQVGMNVENSGNEAYDGYISEFYFIDGQQLAPTSFAETDNNGIWVPKDVKDDLTFGNYGFFLEFKQTGTSQNSSGMGADTSGNDNHFSTDNLAAKEVVVDTPTNNFIVMNPLYTNSRGSFTEGNTQVVTSVQGSVPYGQVEFGNMHLNTGKWYFEVRPTTVGSGGSLGLGVNERAYSGTYTNGHNNGGSAGNIRWNHANGNIGNGSQGDTSASSYANDDILGFAMDLDNSKIYCHKNGTYQNSGDPAAGSNGITMTSAYEDYWTPWMSKDDTSNNATVDFNFGNPQFAISSSNSDANGYGNFEYAVPSGFFAICTRNIAQYG